MQSENPGPYRVTDRRGKHRLRSAFDNAGPELAADEPPAPPDPPPPAPPLSPTAAPTPSAAPAVPTPAAAPAAPAPSRRASALATTRGRLAAAGAVGVVAVAVVAAVVVGRGSPTGSEPASSAGARLDQASVHAVGWLVANTDRRVAVSADPAVAARLRAAGFSPNRLVPLDEVAGRSRGLIVDTARLRSTEGDSATARTAFARSVVLARFGSGAQQADVREVLPARGGPATAARLRQTRMVAADGLLTDVRLRLTPQAWAMLARGAADPRLMSVLADLVASHDVDVWALQRSRPEADAGAPARTALVSAVDGRPVAEAGAGLRDVLRTLRAESAPYRPHVSRVGHWHGRPVLRITYLAPSPLQLGSPNTGSSG